MKFTLNHLKMGDRVEATIEEAMSECYFIANFQGDLVRVKNQSGKLLKKGEKVILKVIGLHPLNFQISSSLKANEHHSKAELDRFV